MKKRWIALLLVLVLVAGVIRAGSAYFNFVAQTIFDESTAHLTEIFHQANQGYISHSLVSQPSNNVPPHLRGIICQGGGPNMDGLHQ